MVYARYIKRDGKTLGPYYYKSVKGEDGKIRSIYLGSKPPAKQEEAAYEESLSAKSFSEENPEISPALRERISKLKKNIQLCDTRKTQIREKLGELAEKQEKGIISYVKHELLLNSYLNGKTVEYWDRYYDELKLRLAAQVKKYESLPHEQVPGQKPVAEEVKVDLYSKVDVLSEKVEKLESLLAREPVKPKKQSFFELYELTPAGRLVAFMLIVLLLTAPGLFLLKGHSSGIQGGIIEEDKTSTVKEGKIVEGYKMMLSKFGIIAQQQKPEEFYEKEVVKEEPEKEAVEGQEPSFISKITSFFSEPSITGADVIQAAPAAPVFTATGAPADSPDPVTQGSTVTFTAAATDANSDPWFLAICTAEGITIIKPNPPTCDVGTLCVSSSSVPISQNASCTWDSTGQSTTSWVGYGCDVTGKCMTTPDSTNSPITVNIPAQAPTCTQSNTNITVDEDTGTWTLDANMSQAINISCTDANGDALTYSFASGDPGTYGDWNNPNNDVLTYATTANQSGGTDVVVITVSDGSLSTVVSAQVIVTTVNDAPWMDQIGNATFADNAEDSGEQPLGTGGSDFNISTKFRDVEDDQTPSSVTPTTNETGVSCSVKANFSVFCTPANNFTGDFIVTFDGQDSSGSHAYESAEGLVTPVNDAPWWNDIANGTVSITEDTVNQNVTIGWRDYWWDVEENHAPTQWDVYSNSSDSPCARNAGGDILCSPTNNLTGNIILILSAEDSSGSNITASFEITVDPVNDNPWMDLIGNTTTITEDNGAQQIVANFNTYFRDVENDQSTTQATFVSNASDVTCAANGNALECTPVNNFTGAVDINYTGWDSGMLAAQQDFIVVVTDDNDVPWWDEVGNATAANIIQDSGLQPLGSGGNDFNASAYWWDVEDGQALGLGTGNLTIETNESNVACALGDNFGSSKNWSVFCNPTGGFLGDFIITLNGSDSNSPPGWEMTSFEGFVKSGNAAPNDPTIILNFTYDDTNYTNESMWCEIYVNDPDTETDMSVDIIIMNSTSSDINTAVQQYSITDAFTSLTEPTYVQWQLDQYNFTKNDYVWCQARVNDQALTSNWVNSSSLKVENYPIMISDPLGNWSVDEDFTQFTLDWTTNYTDPDDVEGKEAYTNWTYEMNDTTILTVSVDNDTDVIAITPIENAFGSVEINWTVLDDSDAQYNETVVWTVNSVNDVPVIENITYQSGLGTNGVLSEAVPTPIIISFLAMDFDGAGDIDNSTAYLNVSKDGSGMHQNVSAVPYNCYPETVGSNATAQNYTCTIQMDYWDLSGEWTCAAEIKDGSSFAGVEVDNCFTVGTTTAINISATALDWSQLFIGDIDKLMSTSELNITNTGNVNLTNITLQSINLVGETTNTVWIPAANFTATWGERSCNTGPWLINDTDVQILGNGVPSGAGALDFGPGSMETTNNATHICLEEVGQDITQQSYSTAEDVEDWTIIGGT